MQLGNFAAEAGLEDPRAWTRRIVHDRNYWGLAFNKWVFDDDTDEPDSVCISDVTANVPAVPDDETDQRLSQLAGQRVLPLGKDGLRKFNVNFRVDPLPGKVPGLARFSVQVISREHGPVGLVRTKAAWSSNRPDATVSFTNLNKVDWEEGWHFIRVLAQSEVGDLLPLVDASGNPIPWTADDEGFAPRPNESDLFYVLPDGEVDVEPPQRARQREESLVHARTRLQFAAVIDERDPDTLTVTSVQWAERRPGARAVGTEMLEIGFGREGTVERTGQPSAEEPRAEDPGGPGRFHQLAHSHLPRRRRPGHRRGRSLAGGRGRRPFPGCAQRVLQGDPLRDRELVTQAADLRALRPLVVDYADAYRTLIGDLLHRAETTTAVTAQRALSDLRKVLAIDTVTLAIRDHRDRRREAALVSPTHPLRALWLATWAELAHVWLQDAKSAPREFAVPTRDALLRLLTPISFPPGAPDGERPPPYRGR